MITSRPLADEILLRRYVNEGDDEAFGTLVDRHTSLVIGVCRQILGPGGDIEDATQSAFLSLAGDAPALAARMNSGGSLAGWVYRVAVNAALQQLRSGKARRRREHQVAMQRPPSSEDPATCASRSERIAIVHEELRDLPACFRGPLVLCHFEGKTQRDAATSLGLSYGTLRRRLEQARRLLKARLERRGVAGAAALTTMALVLRESAVQASGVTSAGQVAGPLSPTIPSGETIVTFIAPRRYREPAQTIAQTGMPGSATIWSCASQSASGPALKWLVPMVITGLALPALAAFLAPEDWQAPRQQTPRRVSVPYSYAANNNSSRDETKPSSRTEESPNYRGSWR